MKDFYFWCPSEISRGIKTYITRLNELHVRISYHDTANTQITAAPALCSRLGLPKCKAKEWLIKTDEDHSRNMTEIMNALLVPEMFHVHFNLLTYFGLCGTRFFTLFFYHFLSIYIVQTFLLSAVTSAGAGTWSILPFSSLRMWWIVWGNGVGYSKW